ncbi:MAG: hypothetical protein WBP81_12830 [Solirubrobacteraceae bacterium]
MPLSGLLRLDESLQRLAFLARRFGLAPRPRARVLWLRFRHTSVHEVCGDAFCFLLMTVSGKAHRRPRANIVERLGMHGYLTEIVREAR